MKSPAENDTTERLGTPEHLDRALYVTTAKAWLALCVLIAMTLAVILWAVWGEVSSYVKAEGIILSRAGMVFDAASSSGGKLARILPAVGETVAEGDLVAEIFDPEIMERYSGAVSLAGERAGILQDRESEAREENALASQNIARQREPASKSSSAPAASWSKRPTIACKSISRC